MKSVLLPLFLYMLVTLHASSECGNICCCLILFISFSSANFRSLPITSGLYNSLICPKASPALLFFRFLRASSRSIKSQSGNSQTCIRIHGYQLFHNSIVSGFHSDCCQRSVLGVLIVQWSIVEAVKTQSKFNQQYWRNGEIKLKQLA